MEAKGNGVFKNWKVQSSQLINITRNKENENWKTTVKKKNLIVYLYIVLGKSKSGSNSQSPDRSVLEEYRQIEANHITWLPKSSLQIYSKKWGR